MPENPLYGSGTYTVDDLACVAAAHAGIIEPAKGGNGIVEMVGRRPTFEGTTHNGIKSTPYTSPWRAFAVRPVEVAKPEPTVATDAIHGVWQHPDTRDRIEVPDTRSDAFDVTYSAGNGRMMLKERAKWSPGMESTEFEFTLDGEQLVATFNARKPDQLRIKAQRGGELLMFERVVEPKQ